MSETWIWNADPFWMQTSCAMEESYHASCAPHDFSRQYHTRACLYFSVSAVETFFNQRLRKILEGEQVDEKEIFKEIRNTKLRDKLHKWPKRITGVDLDLGPEFFQVFDYAESLRHEATHEKRRDHSLYAALDQFHTLPLINTITESFVRMICHGGASYPYWLLGWNFVGLNEETQPTLINNQQFLHALNQLGYAVPAFDHYKASAWEKANMASLEGFRNLKQVLLTRGLDIEPKNPHFPRAPRLTRKWWDRRLILGRDPGLEIPRWVDGWGVVRREPWHLVGCYATKDAATTVKEDYGDSYTVAFGKHVPGTDDFVFA